MDKVRIIIAEDHTIVRQGIRMLLDAQENVEVIGEAENGNEAVNLALEKKPDIVIMDISMPILNGIEASRQIKSQSSGVKIIILSMHLDREYIFKVLDSGADAYILKDNAITELMLAIKTCLQDYTFLSPSVATLIVKDYLQQARKTRKATLLDMLTRREREILQMVAEGLTSKKIAEILYISQKTVERHRGNLMKKIDVHSSAELREFAIKQGIITLE